MKDFSHQSYRALLDALKRSGFAFRRFDDAPVPAEEAGARHVILRHDVDRLPARSLAIARLEADAGAVASYFFRTMPCSFDGRVIREIRALGHEIGYHYEDLAEAGGDAALAWASFRRNLARFEPFGGVSSIAMHGRPLSPHDSRDLWNSHDYREAGVAREVYADIDWRKYYYFTDVGRSWNSAANLRDCPPDYSPHLGQAKIAGTAALIDFVAGSDRDLIISTHPERWAGSFAGQCQVLATDGATNLVKRALKVVRG
ncbi:hypothetical protein [Oceanibacterium hippocampi]|uniref:Polysaccharide deacetylase n=1 Tax=Oceanibacterium hippocampi TaxID=745714 RepID=A0A1Y5RRL6_9PROT|nr:hypothetical protein [Oceanibacterium hippocampi]SLN22666.1 hypothetical protein OCH7691_00604 [Oceanibacterium hippocampi]